MMKSKSGNPALMWRVLTGTAANAITRPQDLRYRTMRELWMAAKRGGSRAIRTVDIRDIPGMDRIAIHGYVDDYNRVIVAALCSLFRSKTFFEFGTERGKTSWTVARNNPDTTIYTLDLPDKAAAQTAKLDMTDAYLFEYWERGAAFVNTPEAERIIELHGDSASFDYTPYESKMDLVYVDGSHSYTYVKNDTEAAFRLLSPQGSILWDDYPNYPGVYKYLNELAEERPEHFFHLSATRLVLCTARELAVSAKDGVMGEASGEEQGWNADA